MKIRILNKNHFCLYKGREVGIASGCFAGDMFKLNDNDDYITKVSGDSFAWFDHKGEEYKDSKRNMTRPTEEQIIKALCENKGLLHVARLKNLIQIIDNTVFSLSVGDWSETLYSHDDKTDEEFKTDVNSLLIKYGNEYLTHSLENTNWASVNDWVDFISPKMVELGYEIIKPKCYMIDSSHIINGSPDDEHWKNIVGEDFYNKSIAHNKEILKMLEKRDDNAE